MVTKILAWSSFGTMLLSAIIALVALFYRPDLGETARTLVWYVALPVLIVSIVLAVALLVWSAFDTES
ncbi:MAG: hypothetical protein ACKOSQ_07705 [Planctomycetaceae bacterium]